MTGNELRKLYLNFFRDRGHAIIPSASLVPQDDPTTLFTSSGMQPLIPYLLGATHPSGKRLVNSQKCFRAQDIDEVGDNRHTTFFEMLGNWSLGDYFKKEQLPWVWEFLTKTLKLPSDKLYVSVFEGGSGVAKDEDSAAIWKSLGVPKDHIFFYPASKNWWSRSGIPDNMPVGEPGGPDSEVFFEFTTVKHNPKFGDNCHPNCDCGRFLEIGNSVFMQYQKQADGTLKEMAQKNVDFGGGLERLLAAVNDDSDIFSTDLFSPLIKQIQVLTGKNYSDHPAPFRVIADHIKAATFLIKDGVLPSNKTQGYVLRRLLRRAAVKVHELIGKIDPQNLSAIATSVLGIYDGVYFSASDHQLVTSIIKEESAKFLTTLDHGLKLLDSLSPFDLFQTYGFPLEITLELYQQRGWKLNQQEFDQQLKHHQDLSRTAGRGMFKGGLQDHSEITTKYHTATHLLHQALRQVLGDHVGQQGSNITAQRLRFDFTHPQALTKDEITAVEQLVNTQISKDLPVTVKETTYKEAQKQGALAFFGQRYPERVTVYSIGDFSAEVCGGPHVESTGQIGPITIYKQEPIGAGRRRLYARLA